MGDVHSLFHFTIRLITGCPIPRTPRGTDADEAEHYIRDVRVVGTKQFTHGDTLKERSVWKNGKESK